MIQDGDRVLVGLSGDRSPSQTPALAGACVECRERSRSPVHCACPPAGGKDSLSLLHILLQLQRKAPIHFDVGACTVCDRPSPRPLGCHGATTRASHRPHAVGGRQQLGVTLFRCTAGGSSDA